MTNLIVNLAGNSALQGSITAKFDFGTESDSASEIKALHDVLDERLHQMMGQYPHERDDEHTFEQMMEIIARRVQKLYATTVSHRERKVLLKETAALSIATLSKLIREEE